MEVNVKAIKMLMVMGGIDTQKQLAEQVGVSENAISEMMKAKRLPSLETLGRICQVLDCTPNDILIVAPKAQVPTAEPIFA